MEELDAETLPEDTVVEESSYIDIGVSSKSITKSYSKIDDENGAGSKSTLKRIRLIEEPESRRSFDDQPAFGDFVDDEEGEGEEHFSGEEEEEQLSEESISEVEDEDLEEETVSDEEWTSEQTTSSGLEDSKTHASQYKLHESDSSFFIGDTETEESSSSKGKRPTPALSVSSRKESEKGPRTKTLIRFNPRDMVYDRTKLNNPINLQKSSAPIPQELLYLTSWIGYRQEETDRLKWAKKKKNEDFILSLRDRGEKISNLMKKYPTVRWNN